MEADAVIAIRDSGQQSSNFAAILSGKLIESQRTIFAAAP
jgi:hypothetical protein